MVRFLRGRGPAAGVAAIGLLLTLPAQAGQRQVLRGHVPWALAGAGSLGRLPGDQRLQLAIGLPLRNREELTNLLEQLYSPASPRYRHYLTPEEFTARFGPTAQDYQALVTFARDRGLAIRGTHSNRMLLDVEASAGAVERAFHLNLRRYRHPREAREFYAPDGEPALDLDVPVLDISGLDDFARPRPAGLRMERGIALNRATPQRGSGPGGTYRGYDFRAAYAPGVGWTGHGQALGLLQFDGYYASDVATYASTCGLPEVPLQNVLLSGFDGTPGSGSSEVTLDIEMAMAMAPGLDRIIVYAGGPDGNANTILNRMATDNLAKQLSSSWTWSPFNATTSQIFQQLAAQGQSFFNASGDGDAYTGAIDKPADSPYITIVGATTLNTTGPAGDWVSESVWNYGGGVGTGGGISTTYAIPTWQRGIDLTASQGSATMRNVPDVALIGDGIWVTYDNGKSGIVAGSSCSAPLWAAFTALVNEQAAIAGLPPVGFINPAIYAIGKGADYASAFHDITQGDNTSSASPTKFYAVPGYDLCSGWGTPTGAALINALAPLPDQPVIVADGYTLQAESCPPGNGAIDPGETVTLNFQLRNLGGRPTTNLTVTLAADAVVRAPSPPQDYGVVAAAGATASRAFTFTADGACGATVTATLWLQDGAADLGSVQYQFPLGAMVDATPLTEDFDAATLPALPSGWTSVVAAGSAPDWVTSSFADSPPNAAFIPDGTSAGIGELVSPPVAIVSTSARLVFRHWYLLESRTLPLRGPTYYDGAVLEIQIGAGTFMDLLAAGGSFVEGGYNATITSTAGNPLARRQAWSGSSPGWMTTTAQLPASAAGQEVRLKWRCATDSGNATPATGWYVDGIAIQDFQPACCEVLADLSVTQNAVSTPSPSGQDLVYTIKVTNAGPALASGVTVTDDLPPGLQLVSASTDYEVLDGAVVCSLGTVPAGGEVNLTLTAMLMTDGPFTNRVEVSSITPDLVLSNNTASLIHNVSGAPLPVITSPPANRVAVAGTDATFQVQAEGTPPLSYQWYFQATNLLAGATESVLTLTNVQPAQAGAYQVVVANDAGAVTSVVAALTVLVPPAISVPPTNRVAVAGTDATFQVQAEGTPPLSYQWSFQATNLLAGATESALTLTNVQPAQAGAYYVVVANDAGAVTSVVAALTVLVPPAISVPPTNRVAVAGTDATFQVQAEGTPPLSYQWYFQATNLLAGATESALTLTNVQPAQAGAYYVVVANDAGAVTSVVATLTVLVPPAISVPPTNRVAVAGTDATFQVQAEGTPPLSYQWYFQATNLLAGATESALTLTNVQPAQAGAYYVVVANDAGAVTSVVATLRVLVAPMLATPVVFIEDQRLSVSLTSVAGLDYTLEYTSSLKVADWIPIVPPVTGTGDIITLLDTNLPPMPGSRYYRVRCE